jgi:hypothetical protein
MTQPNDGGPAFPRPANPPYNSSANGMSLRDYIATHATPLDASRWHQKLGEACNWATTPTMEQAKYAYADAMLKAREQDGD